MSSAHAVRKDLVVCIIVILAFMAVLILRSNETNQHGFNWQNANVSFYEYTAFSKVTLSNPLNPQETKNTVQRVKGELILKVYDSQNNLIKAIAEYSEDNAVSALFAVDFFSDGQISDLQFKRDIDPGAKKKITGVFETLQVSYKPQDGSAWTANEKSRLGEYSTRYKKLPGSEISREVLDFISIKDTHGYADKIEVASAYGKFSPSLSSGWFKKLELNENLKFYRQSSKQLESDLTVSFFENSEKKSAPGWAKMPYQDIIDSLSKPHVMTTKNDVPGEARKIKYSSQLKKNMLTLNTDISAPEILNITELIASDLRTEPYLIRDLLTELKSDRAGEKSDSHLVYALQKTGTATAQAALVEIIESPEFHDRNKRRALIALGSMELNTETEEYLWNLYSKSETDPGSKYSEHAIYALGALADGLHAKEPLRSEDIIYKLSEKLNGALQADNHKKSTALISALGNTASGKAAQKIYPLLTDASDQIRETAADALSNIKADKATQLLSEVLLDEESPSVRKKIIYSLNKKEITEVSLLAVQQAIVEEEDDSLRIDMAKYLLKASDVYRGNRSVIMQILSLETNREVYNILSKILAG